MTAIHATVGTLVIILNLLAGVWGGWCWWRHQPGAYFWPLLRAGQAVLVVQILQGGALVVLGHRTADLHILYGLLPLGVSFIGEQLRVSATESVLTTNGINRAELRDLSDTDQGALVGAVMRREMGVMAVSALVVSVLALRAAQSAGLF